MAYENVSKAALSAACLFLISATSAAWAHGASGTAPAHVSSQAPVGAHAHAGMSAPLPKTAVTSSPGAVHGGPARTQTITPDTTTDPFLTPPPSFAASCENEVGANCEARMEAQYRASGGDLAAPWTAPTPTAVPPTPASPAITEPQTNSDPLIEESGGASPPTTEGGGPTLADCMALWEPDVHMTKALWRTVCGRTLNGIDMPSTGLGLPEPSRTRHHARASSNPLY